MPRNLPPEGFRITLTCWNCQTPVVFTLYPKDQDTMVACICPDCLEFLAWSAEQKAKGDPQSLVRLVGVEEKMPFFEAESMFGWGGK